MNIRFPGNGKIKTIYLLPILIITTFFLGVFVSGYIPNLVANTLKVRQPIESVKSTDELEVKKQSLAEFYSGIAKSNENGDWATAYKTLPKSVRDNLSVEQYINYRNEESRKVKFVSKKTTINNIEVNGNNGTVYRTVITCLTEECTGENRNEDNAKREFEYVNGNWQITDPQPSERALKAANYAFEDSSKNDQIDLLNMFGYGSDSSTFAVRNWAVYLDKNLEELVRVETLVDQAKAEKSRPVYVQQPPTVIQQPAPVIQQNTSPKHCTSNTIGNYTYTNCY